MVVNFMVVVVVHWLVVVVVVVMVGAAALMVDFREVMRTSLPDKATALCTVSRFCLDLHSTLGFLAAGNPLQDSVQVETELHWKKKN